MHVYRYQILQIITFSVLEILLDRSLGVKNHNSTDFPINSTPTLQNEDEVITRHILAEQELFASLFLDHLFHHILSDQFLHYVFRHILFLETVNSWKEREQNQKLNRKGFDHSRCMDFFFILFTWKNNVVHLKLSDHTFMPQAIDSYSAFIINNILSVLYRTSACDLLCYQVWCQKIFSLTSW